MSENMLTANRHVLPAVLAPPKEGTLKIIRNKITRDLAARLVVSFLFFYVWVEVVCVHPFELAPPTVNYASFMPAV